MALGLGCRGQVGRGAGVKFFLIMKTIEEQVVAIANEKLNRDEKIGVEDLGRTLKDLGIDSLDFMLILVGVQEDLELDIPDKVAPTLTTLALVVEYVKSVKG